MIEIRNIHKSYGQTEVLKGIDARVNTGDFITIIGASGAGKSTLLHLLAGLDSPSSGNIVVEGKDLSESSTSDLNSFRNTGVGLVFQFHNLLPELTALENVQLPRLIGGSSNEDHSADALAQLRKLGIEARAQHLPSEMSGGEQQRVAIARALINSPKLLLADEPTGNLDSANAQSVHQLLVQLNEEYGQTIIVVTHNPELAALGKRKWVMKDGKLEEQ